MVMIIHMVTCGYRLLRVFIFLVEFTSDLNFICISISLVGGVLVR
jgi:hypothetical protein